MHNISNEKVQFDELGLYTEAFKGLLCWAHITETGADYFVSKGFLSLRRQKGFVLQIRIAGLSEGGIDLISSQGIIQLMKITSGFISKGMDTWMDLFQNEWIVEVEKRNGLQYHFFCVLW